MNLAIVVYTNETNLPILQLFLDYFFKHNPNSNFSIYVVANKFTKFDLPYIDKVKYIVGNVDFQSNGGHFSETLHTVLPQIKEDYIFYFCEDYIMTHSIDILSLERLLELIQNEDIDMFSFASMYPQNSQFPLLDIDYKHYNFRESSFYLVDKNYMHAFSVQPCIWKKTSLQQLLNDNPKISLHDMDCSILNNKDQYKIVCTNYKIYDGCCPPEYFIIGYIEIIRHGAFLMALNGHDYMEHTYQNTFLKQLIKENNLHTNPEYDRYICFDKSLITW